MVALVTVGVALAVIALIGAAGWPGTPSGCVAAGTCDCEALTDGLTLQPSNTWSNLGFVLVGLWIIAGAGRRPAPDGDPAPVGDPAPANRVPANRMTTEPVYRRMFGGLAILIGLGSMVFHASVTNWGAWADLVPIVLSFAFLAVYAVVRLLDRSTGWFLAVYGSVSAVLVAVTFGIGQANGRLVLGVFLVVFLVIETVLARQPHRHMPGRFAIAATALYLAGGLLWVLGRSGGPWCDPDGPILGHSLWHLAAAAAFAMVYRYLEGESID